MSTLLDRIDSPRDLRGLSADQLVKLAAELRARVVETVSITGGHLGASLGAVEITLALHSVLESPRDRIIWDVGHQAYPHKLLTGRREVFHTLRQYGGISGFPRRCESPHDAFGTAHAGTSISAAVGYAIARDLAGEDYAIATVTGDGAMTAGMVFEALNHAGHLGLALVVILNDNKMSISANVGALSNYLTRLRTEPSLQRAKEDIERLLARIPGIGPHVVKAAEHLKDTVRHLVVPGAFFEELGWKYLGPIDGHNIPLLQRVIREAVSMRRPVLIHAITEKGRGYGPAEKDPGRLHAISAGRPQSGTGTASTASTSAPLPTFSQVFGRSLIEFAKADPRIVAITAAMPGGTGLDEFAEALPKQFFDAGIAEQHVVTMAAGMACGGLRPVAAIYSTFLQRAYDQVIHDVCIQDLPVVFALDRAGLVGDDGATHHGCFDIPYLRAIPNMTIMAPKDEAELRDLLYTALYHQGPTAVRYPRGRGVGAHSDRPPIPVPIGKGEILREGDDIALIAVGPLVYRALLAAERLSAEGVEATVVNARFVKPLDADLILEVAKRTGRVMTIEEGALMGGFGSAVAELLLDHDVHVKMRRIGIPDRFINHGTVDLLHAECGLSLETVVQTAFDMVGAVVGKRVAGGRD